MSEKNTFLQAVIRDLYSPIVDTILRRIQHACNTNSLHLPYPEIPVIYAPNVASDTHLVSLLSTSLQDLPGFFFINKMFPIDCPNISQCMRSLISGFLDQCEPNFNHKSTKSLSDNNVELLKIWSRQFILAGDAQPVLVVVLHEFEQFDHDVLQDMFSILRRLFFSPFYSRPHSNIVLIAYIVMRYELSFWS
jgi:hypothetical protein